MGSNANNKVKKENFSLAQGAKTGKGRWAIKRTETGLCKAGDHYQAQHLKSVM